MSQSDQTSYDLDQLPEGSTLRSVTATPAIIAGRRALRVELTEAVTYEGRPKVDYVDMPTFVILPATFINGTIQVDILSRLNGKGPANARAFAGVAYRITDGGDHFEAVYLRPLNGRKTNPPTAGPACDSILRLSRLAVRPAPRDLSGRPLRSRRRYRS
jgi:hypothetical protein